MSSDEAQTSAPACAPGTLEEELEKIEREQTEAVDLEEKARELDDMRRRAKNLEAELRVAHIARRQRSAAAALPVIHPPEPCAAAWAEMPGGERVRSCARCKARVYDLGGLDPSDARRVLRDHEGHLPSHVVGRVDGTVTVASCRAKRRLSALAIGLAAASAAGLLGSGVALGYVLAPDRAAMSHVTSEPIEIGALVDQLARARADEAKAARPAPPPSPVEVEEAPKAPPPTATPEERDERGRRDERRRRRPRCRGFGMGMHDPRSMPLFYFFETDPQDGERCDE